MTLTFLLFQWPSPSAVLLSFIDERRWLLNYAMLCNWCIHQLSKTILEQTRWIFYQTNFQLWSNSYSEQWYSFVQKSLFIQSHSLCPQKLPVWSQQCLLLLLCCRVMMLKTCDLKHKTSANVSVWMLQQNCWYESFDTGLTLFDVLCENILWPWIVMCPTFTLCWTDFWRQQWSEMWIVNVCRC